MEVIREQGVRILELKGNIQGDQTEQLESILEDLHNKENYKVIVNMKDVKHVCSSALGLLVSYKRNFSKAHGDLKIVLVNDELLQLFEITMLDKIFEIYKTQSEAIDAFAS